MLLGINAGASGWDADAMERYGDKLLNNIGMFHLYAVGIRTDSG